MTKVDPKAPCVTLSRSGMAVSQIGVGLAHVHLMNTASCMKLIETALDLGITHFDTSRFYSDGLSERILGDALRARRSRATITTKFGLLPSPLIGSMGPIAPFGRKLRSAAVRLKLARYPRQCYTVASLHRSLAASLRALRTDHVDVLAIHEPAGADSLTDELIDALIDVRRSGKARFIGVAGDNIGGVVQRWGGALDIIQTAEGSWNADNFTPDFTYSLFASRRGRMAPPLEQADIDQRLASAVARRPDGAVIVQTRDPGRLRRYVEVATN